MAPEQKVLMSLQAGQQCRSSSTAAVYKILFSEPQQAQLLCCRCPALFAQKASWHGNAAKRFPHASLHAHVAAAARPRRVQIAHLCDCPSLGRCAKCMSCSERFDCTQSCKLNCTHMEHISICCKLSATLHLILLSSFDCLKKRRGEIIRPFQQVWTQT